MISEYVKQMAGVESALKMGYHHWMLSRGLSYSEQDESPDYTCVSRYVASAVKRRCYANSAVVAALTGLDYCEGYYTIQGSSLPMPHAFNVDTKTGKFFDVTRKRFNIVVTGWFGVTVPLEYLIQSINTGARATPLEMYHAASKNKNAGGVIDSYYREVSVEAKRAMLQEALFNT